MKFERRNCLVTISKEVLSTLLGGIEVHNVRLRQKYDWTNELEVLVYNPSWPSVSEGAMIPHGRLTLEKQPPLPIVSFSND